MSNATLMAEGDVVLQSQAQMAEQHSTERSSSAGVGLALTYGQGGWSGQTRDWSNIDVVALNPERDATLRAGAVPATVKQPLAA